MRRGRPIRSAVTPTARHARVAALCMPTLMLAACMVGPNYQRPDVSLPGSFRAAGASGPSTGGSENDAPPGAPGSSSISGAPGAPSPALDAALRAWWDAFNDPTLSSLIGRALETNLDLESAAARLERSRALLGISRADLWPSASGDASATRSRSSEELQNGPPGMGGRTTNTLGLSLDASWEIDIFGGRRRAVEAARASVEASQSDLAGVRVSVTGEVADAYLARLGALERLAIAHQTIDSYKDTLGLTRTRARAGMDSELDSALAAAELDASIAAIPALETEVALQENRLAVLLALTPAEVVPLLGGASVLPGVPPIGDRGVPVDLLRRRPDIMAAERRVASASATIGEQVAEYFPRVSVSGSIGLSASDAEDLFQGSARTWSFGPTLQWRLLDFQRIDGAVAAARADERGAIAAYRLAILQAVRDVEDAAAQYDGLTREVAARATAVQSRQRAYVVAERQYSSGLSGFLPVLDARRGLNQATSDLALARQQRARAAVALFRALGGGWETPSDATPRTVGDSAEPQGSSDVISTGG